MVYMFYIWYKYDINKKTIFVGHYHECLLKDDANSVTFAFPDLNNNQGALTYMKNDTAVIGGRTCHPGDTTNPPR